MYTNISRKEKRKEKKSQNVKRVSERSPLKILVLRPDANKSFPILPNIHKDNKKREVRKLVLVILKSFFFYSVESCRFFSRLRPEGEKKMFNFNPLLSASNEIKIKLFRDRYEQEIFLMKHS
jgi:hypothetical protein